MKQPTKTVETVKQISTNTTENAQHASSTQRPVVVSEGIFIVRKYSYDDNGGGYRGL